MKKTYQIQRGLSVKAGESKTFNFQLKENYAKCTGFFLTPSTANTDFSVLTLLLNVAQMEVLPNGTDASLFALTDYISRADATYDFKEENIPAKSSDVQLIVTNNAPTKDAEGNPLKDEKGNPIDNTQTFNVYFVLENF